MAPHLLSGDSPPTIIWSPGILTPLPLPSQPKGASYASPPVGSAWARMAQP